MTRRHPGPFPSESAESEASEPLADPTPAEMAPELDAATRDVLAAAAAGVGAARDQLGRGEHGQAAVLAGQAAARFGEVGWTVAQGRALRLQSDALIGAGRPLEALVAVDAALTAFAGTAAPAEPPRTPADRAGCDAAAGAACRVLGNFAEAGDHLERAAAAYGEHGLPARAALCRLDRAVVLHAAGDAAAAAALLEEVRPQLLLARHVAAVATCDFDRGVAAHDLGSMDDAVEYLQKARATFLSLGQPIDVAGCNQNLGVALQAMGRSDEAVQRLRDAREVYAEHGRDRDAAQCDHNLAVVLRALGDDTEADRLEQQAAAGSVAEVGAPPG